MSTKARLEQIKAQLETFENHFGMNENNTIIDMRFLVTQLDKARALLKEWEE